MNRKKYTKKKLKIACAQCGSSNLYQTSWFRNEHTCAVCGWCLWIACLECKKLCHQCHWTSQRIQIRELQVWCAKNNRSSETLTAAERKQFIGPNNRRQRTKQKVIRLYLKNV